MSQIYNKEDNIFLDLCDKIEDEVIEVFPEASQDYLDDICCDIASFIIEARMSIFCGSDDFWDSLSKELSTDKKWLTEKDIKGIEKDKMLGHG